MNICTSKTFFGAGELATFTEGLFNQCCICASVKRGLAQLGHVGNSDVLYCMIWMTIHEAAVVKS